MALAMAAALVPAGATQGSETLEALPDGPAQGVTSTTDAPAAGSYLPHRGILLELSTRFRNERVIVTGLPVGSHSITVPDEDFRRAQTLLERLQVVAASLSPGHGTEAASPSDESWIPFRVGGAYAIAPEFRYHPSGRLDELTPLDIAERGPLLKSVLLGLTRQEIESAGSEQGIPVAALSPAAREALARSLRPTMTISRTVETSESEDNLVRPLFVLEEIGRVTEPLDPARLRLRVRLRAVGANLAPPDGGMPFLSLAPGSEPVLAVSEERASRWSSGESDLPIFDVVPNTYKPSDLEGRRFRKPFGRSGVMKVNEVLVRIGSNTGLKLKAWKAYGDQPVFIGSGSVSDGEVLDALRLCFTASWRKLGDTFLLAWDRTPLLAIQLSAMELEESLGREIRKYDAQAETDPGWITLVRTLPFSPDDPLALTDLQRDKLFPADPAYLKSGNDIPPVGWADLTPGQQDTIRERAQKDRIEVSGPTPDVPSSWRPCTEEDLRTATLFPGVQITISVSIPGHGWVRIGDSWDINVLTSDQMRRIVARDDPDSDTAIDAMMDDELIRLLAEVKPSPLPSETRILIVPALGPARLAELAEEMKRHGLNVLFYPALFGGYATFPARSFPLHPSLRGEDGFKAAVAAMKPKGIQVVGYLNTLAWQNASDKVHWLSKYPHWLDVDALGRPRLEWADACPEMAGLAEAMGVTIANYVRASEPLVEARLKSFIAEFAERDGSDGIAFAEYAPSGVSGPFQNALNTPPGLGLGMDDRLSVFHATGVDPADAVTGSSHLPYEVTALVTDAGSQVHVAKPGQMHEALLGRLLAEAKARKRGWTTWVLRPLGSEDLGPEGLEAVKPDRVILPAPDFENSEGNVKAGLAFPVSRRNLLESILEQQGEPVTLPKAIRELPAVGLFSAFWKMERPSGLQRLSALALDFRCAPDLIAENLKWILPPPPGDPAGAKAGATGPAPARPDTRRPPGRFGR